ncbi:DUF4190 domain-containing protein [Nonomuraea sp. NPDC005983]|uniref:DUF4190 domain-containing protein n=1 Tax=Nonomuraea sp. NPDC005983 TaxID=3155595 RepID=UPI0033B24E4B
MLWSRRRTSGDLIAYVSWPIAVRVTHPPSQPEEPGTVPYGFPYEGAPPRPVPRPPVPSGLAKASLAFGIVAVVLSCVLLPLGGFSSYGIFGVAAIVTGHKARKEIKTGVYSGNKIATVGLLLGCVGLLVTIYWLISS